MPGLASARIAAIKRRKPRHRGLAYARSVQTAADRPRPDRAPRSGRSTRTWRRHHDAARRRRATVGADLVVFPELGLTGYQLQDLASEVAMRLDDPRLAELAARDARPVGGRLVRRGVGRPPAVHRGRPARGRRDPARPPQAVPADLRPVRRAPVLRRRRRPAGGAVAARASASGSAICEDFWHLPVPQLLAPRRRPDPDQRVVVAGPRPGRDQRGRARDGDLVADADADLRPADDLVRRVLQPRRRRRVDLVLGRLGGHRPERRGRLQRAALRRGPVHRRHRDRPTSGASGSRCRCCATSGPSCSVRELEPDRRRAGRAWRPTRRPSRGAEPGFDVAPAERAAEPIGFGSDGERPPRAPTAARR